MNALSEAYDWTLCISKTLTLSYRSMLAVLLAVSRNFVFQQQSADPAELEMSKEKIYTHTHIHTMCKHQAAHYCYYYYYSCPYAIHSLKS